MNDSAPFTGGCLCGAIRFHCSLCRRAHGAAFVTWFGVERSRFELVAGADRLVWYQSTPRARRGFCSCCGSTLFFEGDRWPDEVHVALAHMDGPIDRRPKAHVFFDTHVDWVELGDDLPRLGGPEGNQPLDPED